MRHPLYSAICGASFLLLAACGSPMNSSNPPRNLPMLGAPATIRGIVRDESGAPVAGVRIVAQGRLANNKAEAAALTGADGSYTLTAPAAAYDVGLDLPDSDRFAVNYYGPVAVREGATRDFVMHAAPGMESSTVFGRIFLRPGAPANTRMVRLAAMTAARHGAAGVDAEIPAASSAMTDANGSFRLDLGSGAQSIGLDVEMHESNGELDEYVSIATLGKPTYVEFVTEEIADEDTSRAGRLSDTELAALTGAGEPLEGGRSAYSVTLSGSASQFNSQINSNMRYEFRDGRMKVADYSRLDGWQEYCDGPGLQNLPARPGNTWHALDRFFNWYDWTGGDTGEMLVNRGGSWWYTYRFAVRPRGTLGADIRVTDAEGDTYSLGVSSGTAARVDYNSRDADVVKLVFTIRTS